MHDSVEAAADAQVLAVAEAALAAISRDDINGFTDLMVPEGIVVPTFVRDGVPGYTVRTRAAQQASPMPPGIVERGFRPEVRIAGKLATVWMPYDFYVGGVWSHCGVDVLTLVQTKDGWRISTFSFSIEQPPACSKHPSGPPVGTK